jgi:hypothetical protein
LYDKRGSDTGYAHSLDIGTVYQWARALRIRFVHVRGIADVVKGRESSFLN